MHVAGVLISFTLALVGSACGGESDGFTPQERATQLAEEAYRMEGDVPPADLECEHLRTEPGGAQWFECNPGGIHIACTGETTDTPLTDTMSHERVEGSDCAFD